MVRFYFDICINFFQKLPFYLSFLHKRIKKKCGWLKTQCFPKYCEYCKEYLLISHQTFLGQQHPKMYLACTAHVAHVKSLTCTIFSTQPLFVKERPDTIMTSSKKRPQTHGQYSSTQKVAPNKFTSSIHQYKLKSDKGKRLGQRCDFFLFLYSHN